MLFFFSLLSVCLAHSGVFIYHWPSGDTGGGWQKYDWSVLTNGSIFHDGCSCDAQGNWVDCGGYPDTQLASQAKKYNTSYLPVVEGNWEQMLRSTSAQTTLINNCVSLLKSSGGAGVSLDFEGMPPDYKDDYNTFVTNLYNTLHPLGYKVYIAVPIDINGWPGGVDDVTLAKVSDGLFYMGYDINWGNQQAAANAPLPQVESYIQDSLNAGIASKKIILGVPWYGYSYACNTNTPNTTCITNDAWPQPDFCYQSANSSATTYGARWDTASQTPYWEQLDSNGRNRLQGWFDNPQSTTLKYQYAKQKNLLGVGMWYAGCGDGNTDLWQALNAFV